MADFEFHTSFQPVSIRKPRVLSSKFGDGYEQRGLDGINSDMQKWSLGFENCPPDEADDIEDFLAGKAGVTPFTWVPPRAVSTIKVICKEWERKMTSPNSDSLRMTFEQVADP